MSKFHEKTGAEVLQDVAELLRVADKMSGNDAFTSAVLLMTAAATLCQNSKVFGEEAVRIYRLLHHGDKAEKPILH